MSKLVLDLQRDALNRSVSVEDLLRKALAVSVKIGYLEVQEWLNNELNGYSDIKKVPQYRKITGIMKAFNPMQGWIPVSFESDDFRLEATTQANMQTIGEISKLAEQKTLRGDIPSEFKREMCKQNGVDFDIQLFVSPTSMVGILEAVRNTVLKWALDLEKEGILGEDMSFTCDELKKAESNKYTIINNIGVMNNSQIQQLSDGVQQNIPIERLEEVVRLAKGLLEEGELGHAIGEELSTEIATIEVQKKSHKPKGLIIRESLKTIRTIAEGIAGSVIAAELIAVIQTIVTS